MARIAYLAVLLVVAAYIMVETGEALSCDEPKIGQTGRSCNPFTSGNQPEPSGECCQVFRELRALAKTTEQRRKYCSCVHESITKNIAPSDFSFRIPKIDALPEKCGLPFLFPSDPKFDCNTLN